MENVLKIKVSWTQFWLLVATVIVVETAILTAGLYLSREDGNSERRAENISWLGGVLLRVYTADELAQFFSKEDPWESVLEDYKSKNVPGISYDWIHESVYGPPVYEVNRGLGKAIAEKIPPVRVPVIWEGLAQPRGYVFVVFLDGHRIRLSEKELWDLTKEEVPKQ